MVPSWRPAFPSPLHHIIRSVSRRHIYQHLPGDGVHDSSGSGGGASRCAACAAGTSHRRPAPGCRARSPGRPRSRPRSTGTQPARYTRAAAGTAHGRARRGGMPPSSARTVLVDLRARGSVVVPAPWSACLLHDNSRGGATPKPGCSSDRRRATMCCRLVDRLRSDGDLSCPTPHCAAKAVRYARRSSSADSRRNPSFAGATSAACAPYQAATSKHATV